MVAAVRLPGIDSGAVALEILGDPLMKTRLPLVVAALLLCGASASAQNTACSRECLRSVLDSYFLNMARHDPAKLNVTATLKFTENGQALKPGEGFWKTAGSASYKLYAFDTQSGAAAAQAVVRENGMPVLFLLRIRVEGRAIAEAETIVARKGNVPFFAPEKLTQPDPFLAGMVAMTERNTRQQLRDVADAYFSAVQSAGTPAYKPASFADDATRFENGMQTTNVEVMGMPAATAAEQLDKAYFKGQTVTKRRFPVIDVDHGLVLGIAVVNPTGVDGLLLAELFKITGGKIRQIQAVMVNQPKNGPTGWN